MRLTGEGLLGRLQGKIDYLPTYLLTYLPTYLYLLPAHFIIIQEQSQQMIRVIVQNCTTPMTKSSSHFAPPLTC